jgi:hypothetical protein
MVKKKKNKSIKNVIDNQSNFDCFVEIYHIRFHKAFLYIRDKIRCIYNELSGYNVPNDVTKITSETFHKRLNDKPFNDVCDCRRFLSLRNKLNYFRLDISLSKCQSILLQKWITYGMLLISYFVSEILKKRQKEGNLEK